MRAHRAALVLLVPALAALGWTVSAEARDGWWVREPHRAVLPGAEGWAAIEGTAVRLVELSRVEELTDSFTGEPWHPPEGYDVWRISIEVRSDLEEVRYCDVRLLDGEGRVFTTPGQVPDIPGAPVMSSLSCGGAEEGTEPSTEAWFVLPEGSEPARLDLTSSRTGELGLGPELFALPL
ncbi:hypothetical protein [Georgenia daeguensis]|uniref:DUF4352 domain-containing protein n=1 Tax=Georgenia daeguensis TaxID=908355 RepID=A0ABP8EWZ7_9MICO